DANYRQSPAPQRALCWDRPRAPRVYPWPRDRRAFGADDDGRRHRDQYPAVPNGALPPLAAETKRATTGPPFKHSTFGNELFELADGGRAALFVGNRAFKLALGI